MSCPESKLILASRSPRRRALLETLGFEVVIREPTCDETPRSGETAVAMVLRLARRKAESVTAERHEVVVGADTLVVRDDVPIGKPKNDAEALAILESLAGRTHRVVTGFWLRRGARSRGGAVWSQVTLRSLERAEIQAYVSSGEPRDKAGAYAIQGRGGALIETIAGSYTNIVGLPLREVLEAVKELTSS